MAIDFKSISTVRENKMKIAKQIIRDAPQPWVGDTIRSMIPDDQLL